MEIKVLQQPDSAIAHIFMESGEEFIAEAGSMIAMSGFINTSTTLRKGRGGGIMGGIKRMLAGESLFLSTFRCPRSEGELFLAPPLLGDILLYRVSDPGLIVQATSYLGSDMNVNFDLGWQGFKSFFSGENLFWLDVTGNGYLLLSSFGAIYEVLVEDEYIVDTGHIVAFEKGLTFEIRKAGKSLIGAFLGGEGLVCRFQGRGRVFCQTHNPTAFGKLVGGLLPAKS